jgi:hypothetical protein
MSDEDEIVFEPECKAFSGGLYLNNSGVIGTKESSSWENLARGGDFEQRQFGSPSHRR